MNYKETLKYISASPKFSQNLGNADLIKLLGTFENPQDDLHFVHVAGTNGKGSVCAMTALALQRAGFKTGLYTSPFINIFNERIQINGENIPDAKLAQIATSVKNRISELHLEISEFAQITAIAFIYFKAEGCDFVVLETGLGGRLDATNVISTPSVCAITKIGLDHTEYLGSTLSQIAAEKCGIIKNNVPVVTCSNQPDEALNTIRQECEKHSSPLIIADCTCDINIGMSGTYQKYNAGICKEIIATLGMDYMFAKYGIENAFVPARFEFLQHNLIVDGGHNPDAVNELIKSLAALGKPVTFVIAMMQDKDYISVCEKIKNFGSHIVVTQLDMPRCLSAEKLAKEFGVCDVVTDCRRAVEFALNSARDGVVCVCGSLYLAGEVRKYFNSSDKLQ